VVAARWEAGVRGVIGMDVGGVNTKAAWLWDDGARSGRTASRPFEVWREREALTAVIAAVVHDLGAGRPDAVALTTTAELSDAFRTKREGVAFVLDAVEEALGGVPLRVFTTRGELVDPVVARDRPLEVAASNWVATAQWAAGAHDDALLIDVGSTTADIIPILGGRVAASGWTDLDRLLSHELVYTGALRTNLAGIAREVPVRGGACPVAPELFAISADMHVVLGHIEPSAYTCPTPDGRDTGVASARERIARLVCSDAEQLAAEEIDAIARHLHGAQVAQLTAAAERVGARVPAGAPVVGAGAGLFLVREVAARIGREVVGLPGAWDAAAAEVAPAVALAELLLREARAA
jgi:(4-(4-[2-(gamma-L-glutamylamino)ethyl]phenoxymethyl)furan-2-yl)methanamine synthase